MAGNHNSGGKRVGAGRKSKPLADKMLEGAKNIKAIVRPENANLYSRWEPCPVRSSQPPVLSLGAEVVTLGLSVGRGTIEPQSERVKQ